jgi:nitroreductase
MNYSAAVRDTWRHYDLADAARDYVSLVQYATLAASSHNTQPWKFELEPGRILILPDLSRRCPEVDSDDHHLFASLGCAAENLLLAAQVAGLHGHLSYEASTTSMQVDFEPATPSPSPLFQAIPRRQCSRSEYDGTEISGEHLRLLEQAGGGHGVSVLLLTDAARKEQIAEYVAAGNTAQFADRRWADEMKKWIRFNGREAVSTGDGLYGRVLGIPAVPRWLGSLLMGVVVSAERQNRKDVTHIRSSGAIAVLYSEADDRRHWIEAGRSYERLALQATALGLRTAFINQPVEVPELRPQLASVLGIGHRRPDLIVRIGRGPEMPRSLRRPVQQVIHGGSVRKEP